MNLEARGSYKYSFKWEYNVSNTNSLCIKEKLIAGFSPTEQVFLWAWTTPYNSCFKYSILSPGIYTHIHIYLSFWGGVAMPEKNSRFQFVRDLNLVQNSTEAASLQQSPKQESMHLLSTCQIPFRYSHKSSNGICFKVRFSSAVIDF